MEERPSVPFNDDTPLDKAVPSNSNYLSKEDVDPPILVEIAYMTSDVVEADGKSDQKAVLHFTGDVKPLILNHTNKETLKAVTGAQTAGQVKGKQIILFNDPTVSFGKKLTGGVRMRAAQQEPVAAPVSHVPDIHEDIPYEDISRR